MTHPLSRPSYRADIDGLRALAVLGVVLFHAFPSMAVGGFVGVDVFFVISGFLISTLLYEGNDRGGFSVVDFYDRRIRRIFPALLATLVAVLAFGWFALLDDEYAQLGKHSFAGAVFLSNFALWREAGYFDIDSQLKPLMHLWSLAVEEQFYLVWPVILMIALKFKLPILRLSVIIATASLALNLGLIWQHPSATFYMPFTRFWELLAGAILAYISLYQRAALEQKLNRAVAGVPLYHLLSVSGFALIAVAMQIDIDQRYFPGAWALLPVMGTVFIIAAGQKGILNARILSHKTAVWIGLISYPLYIWHWPLLSYLRIVESGTAPAIYRLIAVFLAFALAYLTYIFIEKPVRQGRVRYAAGMLFTSMMLVGAFGFIVHQKAGFPNRPMPVSQEQLQSFKWDSTRNIDARCVTKFNMEQSQLAYCLADDLEARPDVAVIGDSHSNQMFWALRDYYRQKGQNLIGLGGPGGCMPFYGGSTISGLCEKSMDDILALIAHTPSIKTVILGARASYISDMEQFKKILLNSFVKFKALNRTVVFVLDAPEIGFDPKRCMDARRFRIGTDSASESCNIPRKKIEAAQKAYRETVFTAAEGFSNVQLLDLPALMCDDTLCWGKREGMILYRDTNHLSVWGTQYIGEHVRLPNRH